MAKLTRSNIFSQIGQPSINADHITYLAILFHALHENQLQIQLLLIFRYESPHFASNYILDPPQ